MRKLALAIAGLALALLVAILLRPGRLAGRAAAPAAIGPGPPAAADGLREPLRTQADGRAAVATEPDAAAAPARSCPDLASLVAEQAALLASGGSALERDWIPAASALAGDLDGHCLDGLVELALDTRRSGQWRLAAWSIVAAGERPAPGWSLAPASRSWLWSCAETRTSWEDADAQGPAQATDSSRRRDLVAGAAACCLVRLGDARDRARLVDGLGGTTLGRAALSGLQQARDRDVIPAALAVLEGAGRGLWDAALLITTWSQAGVLELSTSERERAAGELLALWHENDPPEPDNGQLYSRAHASLLLTQLAPQLALDEWRRQVDAGAIDRLELPQAAQALALRAAPEDLARLDGLLGGSDSWGRLKVAQALLEGAPAGAQESPQVASARRELVAMARSDEPVHLRLLALDRARSYCPGFGELALDLLAHDPDESVRLKALVGLGLGFLDGAGAREALERASLADSDAAVRREALRILEREGARRAARAGSGAAPGN